MPSTFKAFFEIILDVLGASNQLLLAILEPTVRAFIFVTAHQFYILQYGPRQDICLSDE